MPISTLGTLICLPPTCFWLGLGMFSLNKYQAVPVVQKSTEFHPDHSVTTKKKKTISIWKHTKFTCSTIEIGGRIKDSTVKFRFFCLTEVRIKEYIFRNCLTKNQISFLFYTSCMYIVDNFNDASKSDRTCWTCRCSG